MSSRPPRAAEPRPRHRIRARSAGALLLLLGALWCVPARAGAQPESPAEAPAVDAPAPAESQPEPTVETAPYVRRMLREGGPLRSTNGITVDPDGRLIVVSATGNTLTILDPDTGDIVVQYGQDDGVISPDDVAVRLDGGIYWTAILPGTISRLTPEGAAETFADFGRGINALRFSPDGTRMFASKAMLGDGFYEVDPSGDEPPRLLHAHVGWSNSMSFGPDGRVYAPLVLYGSVVRYDVDAGAIDTLAAGFEFAVAAKFNPKGELFVLDGGGARTSVVQVRPATGAMRVYATLEHGGDNMAFDARGRLFVTNHPNGDVVEVRPDGTTRTVVPGGLVAPGGMDLYRTAAGDDRLLVADFWSLRELDPVTGEQTHVTYTGFQPPEPPAGAPPYTYNPLAHGAILPVQTVHVNGDAAAVLSSWFGNVVQDYDLANHRLVAVHAGFQSPNDALRFQGDLIVSEMGTQSVVRVDAETGERETLADGLLLPGALAATDDDLYVADWASGHVLQLVRDGAQLPEPLLLATVEQPEGLTVEPAGTLLVVESGRDRLVRVDPATGAVTVLAPDLGTGFPAIEVFPPSMVLAGVAADAGGAVYVAADNANQVLRLTPR